MVLRKPVGVVLLDVEVADPNLRQVANAETVESRNRPLVRRHDTREQRPCRRVHSRSERLPGVVEERGVDAGEQEPAEGLRDAGVHEDVGGLRAGTHCVVAEHDRALLQRREDLFVPAPRAEAVVVGDPGDMREAVEEPERGVDPGDHGLLRAEHDAVVAMTVVPFGVRVLLPDEERQAMPLVNGASAKRVSDREGGDGSSERRAENEQSRFRATPPRSTRWRVGLERR